jgi:undecaprenyl phosphate N,N'-diacetylbacillosamine 1-phosphate transferase
MNSIGARFIKRFIDIFVSMCTIIIFLPIWLMIALLVKITSPGPVFFIQNRPGYQKKSFRIYKFRTMKVGSEEMIKGREVTKEDNRITKFGRFLRRSKLDEIPQLLNVLRGEMSLIGPRPERLASLEDYDDEISKRLNMRPGLTGLAQVSGNIYLDLADRYSYDVYYIENYSLYLDLKIVLRTFGVVLFGEERYVTKPLLYSDQNSKADGV